jgi:hypothetical protein
MKVSSLSIGKLSLKPEAAGKTRVFAIVDYWSQCTLKMLHEGIFTILRNHPSDATFDQDGSLMRFAEKGFSEIFSFDLSSATDMIPIQIQTMLLSRLLGNDLAKAWERLLVDRDYRVPKGTSIKSSTVRYTRGQPIGALSSWAMLALTHHFLVYVAAHRANIHPFSDYVVCGDDIAIGSPDVAKTYFDLCAELGIPISVPKSLKSSSDAVQKLGWSMTGAAFNFVSRTLVGTTDLSPVSLKEEIAIFTPSDRAQSVLRAVKRGHIEK